MVKAKKNKGFTLVELLVVISVLAVLSSLLISNLNNARVQARDTQRKSDFSQIKKALQLYFNDYGGIYPANSGNQIAGCGADGTSACNWGGFFGHDTTDYYYMKLLPTDPLDAAPYQYQYTRTANTSYCLQTTLENEADKDILASQNKCSACEPAAGFGTAEYVVCED